VLLVVCSSSSCRLCCCCVEGLFFAEFRSDWGGDEKKQRFRLVSHSLCQSLSHLQKGRDFWRLYFLQISDCQHWLVVSELSEGRGEVSHFAAQVVTVCFGQLDGLEKPKAKSRLSSNRSSDSRSHTHCSNHSEFHTQHGPYRRYFYGWSLWLFSLACYQHVSCFLASWELFLPFFF